MHCNHKDERKPKISRLKIILTLVVIFSVVGGLLGYYWPHLLWKYREWRLEPLLKKFTKVSNSPMPRTDVPKDWVEYSLGCVQFHLPSDISLSKNWVTTESSTAEFRSEKKIIRVEQDSLCLHEVLQTASRKHPAQKTFSTLSQLRLESCGVVADDFCWSMSRREVQWHIFIASLRPVIVRPDVKHIESLSERNWEGLLFFFRERNHVHFDWQCISCPIRGYIHFYPENEEELDINNVRAVIQSLKVNCGCCDSLNCACPSPFPPCSCPKAVPPSKNTVYLSKPFSTPRKRGVKRSNR
jgi:hypothetical protein